MNYKKVVFIIKGKRVDLLIIVACITIFIPFTFFNKPFLVGDGSEYYALSLAWSRTHKPYMTNASWEVYGNLVASGEITGLVDASILKDLFPNLSLGSTADFNHFWFYSFCAAVISEFGDIVWIRIPIHATFLLLHCFLLASMCVIAWRNLGWKGLSAVIILSFLSPIIWYFDKVHTEFFTYCVTTIAVIYFLRRRYFSSAFFLALAATQNISFAVLSLVALGFGLIIRGKEKYSFDEAALLVLTVAVLALHPAYYYSRFGVLSPQMLTGGANVGSNLRYAYIWLFDPDLGLLPNWPFGIVILLLSFLVLHGRKLHRLTLYPWLLFVACYVLISLWAQSSTTNLNSGATPGLARYSLWYLALFFPVVILLLERINTTRWIQILSIGLLAIGITLNFLHYNPNLESRGDRLPTSVSLFVQTYLPKIYNPPPEIFSERYSGLGDMVNVLDTIAVFGPDCRKYLFMNPIIQDQKQVILGGKGCGFDFEKLKGIIEQNDILNKSRKPIYASLSAIEFQNSQYEPYLSEWISASMDGNATGMMEEGWDIPEIWGTWSEGQRTAMTILCPLVNEYPNKPLIVSLEMQPFIAPMHPRVNIKIYVGTNQVWSGSLDKLQIVQIDLPTNTCISNNKFNLRILIENPISPESLGLSSDKRELGVGLKRIRYDIYPEEQK